MIFLLQLSTLCQVYSFNTFQKGYLWPNIMLMKILNRQASMKYTKKVVVTCPSIQTENIWVIFQIVKKLSMKQKSTTLVWMVVTTVQMNVTPDNKEQ